MSDDLSKYSDSELLDIAQGCTEFSCMYHGWANLELRERGVR